MVPPLVLLHAFPLDSRLFDPVRAALPEFALITPDLAGFGASDLPDGPPDLARCATAVVADLDRRGIEKAIVGGVSVGGYIAMALVRDHPGRVAGMVLADTRATADDPGKAAQREAVAARADRGETESGKAVVASLVADGIPAEVLARLSEMADQAPAGAVAWMQRAMAARPDSTAVLSALEIPVLVLVGEHDRSSPLVEAERIATATRTRPVVLAGAGHLTPAEAPDAFADAIRRWLMEHFR